MTDDTNTEDNTIELKKKIEKKREEIKNELNLTDQDFDIIVRDMIIDAYTRVGVRLSVDDPIFTLLLTNKRVIDYNFKILNDTLEKMPDLLTVAIEESLNRLSESASNLSDTLEEFVKQLDENLKVSNLKARDDLEQKLLTSTDLIINKLKAGKEETSKTPLFTKISLIICIILLIANILFSSFISQKGNTHSKDIEYKYNVGLLNGYDELKHTLSSKDYAKVKSIINDSIEKELKR